MEANLLLETYLKALRLPTFLQNYRKFAEDAAQANLTYDRFLLALAEQEMAQRERNRIARRIKAARFPVLKELADFDFSCISSPNKQRVLELAQGSYIQQSGANPDGGESGPGKDPRRDRDCVGSLPPGTQGALLQRRWLGQRADCSPGRASTAQVLARGPATPADRPGRAGLHPFLVHRRPLDVPVLLRALRTGGDDCDDQPALRRLGAGLWR